MTCWKHAVVIGETWAHFETATFVAQVMRPQSQKVIQCDTHLMELELG
jgi:hypothetical protein